MFWMRAYPLLGQVGGGWALGLESFLGPMKWHRDDRRGSFGAQKLGVGWQCGIKILLGRKVFLAHSQRTPPHHPHT